MKKFRMHGLIIAAAFVAALATAAVAGAQEAKVKGTISTKGLSQPDFAKASRLSLEEASRIAKDKVQGEILSLSLENEDGYLVYAVNVASRVGGIHEVIVDAGSGKVLASNAKGKNSRADDEEEDGDDD